MPEKKQEKEQAKDQGPFSVVDRRRFTSEGERRPDAESAPEPPPAREKPLVEPAAPRPEPPPSTSAPFQESEAGKAARQAYDRQRGPRDYKVDFETLVMSLSTSAMYQLGLVEDPTRAGIPTDPEAARHTIDMLGIIQEKTRGNLSAREAQLLDQVLYELRLAYVHVSSGKKPDASKGA